MPEGFNSDVIRYCEISEKLTSRTEKAPICEGTAEDTNFKFCTQIDRKRY